MFAVIEKARVLRLPVDIVCELFNVCVVPVLLYGSEIRGFENLRDVEIFIEVSCGWYWKYTNLPLMLCYTGN